MFTDYISYGFIALLVLVVLSGIKIIDQLKLQPLKQAILLSLPCQQRFLKGSRD